MLILSGIKLVGTPHAAIVIAISLGVGALVLCTWLIRQSRLRRVATQNAT